MGDVWVYCRFCGHTMSKLAQQLSKSDACPGRRPGTVRCGAPVSEYAERPAPAAPSRRGRGAGGGDDGEANGGFGR